MDINNCSTPEEKVALMERVRETGEPIAAWPEMRASGTDPVCFAGWSGRRSNGEAFSFDWRCLGGETLEIWSDDFNGPEDLMPPDCQSGCHILEYKEHSIVFALNNAEIAPSVWISGIRYRTDETFKHILALNLCGEFDVCIYRLTSNGEREPLYERDFCCK